MRNIALKVGQTLLVELKKECLVGELRHTSIRRNVIQLSNVRDITTYQQRGIQYYHLSEVRTIQILKEPGYFADRSLANAANDDSTQALSKHRGLTLHYLDATLEKIQKCVFINQTDTKYHDAIKYLKTQREFGVCMESIEDGQNCESLSLMSFVTCGWIFIFDIKWMNITKDLGDLLSSDRHRRVIHNEKMMKDVLQRFGILLGRCVDIMIDAIAVSETEGKMVEEYVNHSESSIQHYVEKYLKIPVNFFSVDVNFHERPLKKETKVEAAKNVAFLLDLLHYMVHEILLEKFYGNCDMYVHNLT